MLADDPGVRKGERQRALDPNQDRKHHDDPRRTVASGRLQSEAWPVSDRYGWPASYCKPWPAPQPRELRRIRRCAADFIAELNAIYHLISKRAERVGSPLSEPFVDRCGFFSFLGGFQTPATAPWHRHSRPTSETLHSRGHRADQPRLTSRDALPRWQRTYPAVRSLLREPPPGLFWLFVKDVSDSTGNLKHQNIIRTLCRDRVLCSPDQPSHFERRSWREKNRSYSPLLSCPRDCRKTNARELLAFLLAFLLPAICKVEMFQIVREPIWIRPGEPQKASKINDLV
jgi:hypothetical protein